MCQFVRTGVHCFKRSEINGLHRLSQATGEKIFIPGENFHEDILSSAHKCYFCLWVSLPCRRRHASHKVFPKKDWCMCVCAMKAEYASWHFRVYVLVHLLRSLGSSRERVVPVEGDQYPGGAARWRRHGASWYPWGRRCPPPPSPPLGCAECCAVRGGIGRAAVGGGGIGSPSAGVLAGPRERVHASIHPETHMHTTPKECKADPFSTARGQKRRTRVHSMRSGPYHRMFL